MATRPLTHDDHDDLLRHVERSFCMPVERYSVGKAFGKKPQQLAE